MTRRAAPRTVLPVLLLPAFALLAASAWSWLPVLPFPTSSDLRGVSTPSDGTAWITGTKGACLLTRDAGRTWRTTSIPGAESLDFRDIEAFDAKTAVLMSAGEGAASRVFTTSDAGRRWTEALRNPDVKGFFDAIAFFDRRRGLLVGDPVEGKFAVFATENGGSRWTRVPGAGLPPALPSEGAFAASGTCLAVEKNGRAWFATGGSGHARVFRSDDGGRRWDVSETPLAAGTPSSGIFSLAFSDSLHGVAVGGDYRKPHGPASIARTEDGGATWIAVVAPPAFDRFLSTVSVVPGTTPTVFVAAGTEISGWSDDGGRNWSALESGWNAVAFPPAGDGWAVGPVGTVGRLPSRDAGWRRRPSANRGGDRGSPERP